MFAEKRLILSLLVAASAAAGCAPLAVWLDTRDDEIVQQVERLPPGYAPLRPQPAYRGPHPSSRPFDVDQFALPVQLGEIGPVDHSLGPLQYPFACETVESGLGQPLVDNEEGIGTAVVQQGEIVGYSKDCLLQTRAEYFFKPRDRNRLLPLAPDTDPADIAQATVAGAQVPFVVRLERGTINRFIYTIAVLADPGQALNQPSPARWNRKLIYYFRGGVGIGKRQGDAKPSTATRDRLAQLQQGYGIAFSTGTQTSVHYNMRLAAHTAAMVKRQFVELYGEPEYTVGIGGSGGAVQQHLIAQNLPGLLDALIPQYSYPDMVTQTIWAYDCELLEYYFDVTARRHGRWRDQHQRTLVEGMAADPDADNLFNAIDFWVRLANLRWPRQPRGATECAASWRGLTPLTNNPTYTHHRHRYTTEVFRASRWSHWHDLQHIYGISDEGFAQRTYDNVGVQYGLQALRTGAITPAEFLHLNANIGTWKPAENMRQERYWRVSGHGGLRDVRLWSDHNMLKTPGAPIPIDAFAVPAPPPGLKVAPRSTGDLDAIQAAYRSGHVFLGTIDLPIVDVRHYLDDQLDMHHSFASFATRLRLARGNGHTDNHLIWVAAPPYDPTREALTLIDEWLERGRPEHAADACWDSEGDRIAAGHTVWDGAWNGRPAGTCLTRYRAYASPRDAAGGPRAGDIFKCHRQDVTVALTDGTYGNVDMRPHAAWLELIFPEGVCDYSRGDAGRPTDLNVH